MPKRDGAILLVLLLLAGAACAVLAVESRPDHRQRARTADFQRLVGGLGFGPAGDLSGCAFGFDPRLDGSCAENSGPIPGGSCFCPRHAGSLLYYAPLENHDAPPR